MQYRNGEKHQVAEPLSRLNTSGHNLAEIDYDLSDELTVDAVVYGQDAFNLEDTYEDRQSYHDTVLDAIAIANVVTQSCTTGVHQTEKKSAITEMDAKTS